MRATDEELEALQAELDSVRRASSMSTAIEAPAAPEPAVAAVAPEMSPMAWRGPPGLVAPASVGDAEQILVLVDEFGRWMNLDKSLQNSGDLISTVFFDAFLFEGILI